MTQLVSIQINESQVKLLVSQVRQLVNVLQEISGSLFQLSLHYGEVATSVSHSPSFAKEARITADDQTSPATEKLYRNPNPFSIPTPDHSENSETQPPSDS